MKMKRITSGLLSLVMTVGLLLPGVQATERLDTAASSVGGEETARYLCDMEWESATLGTGMYEIEVDKECDGKPLQLEGEDGAAVDYEHGIGTHASSEIIYNIEGLKATRFTCDYGASKSKADSDNPSGESRTSVTFQIYVDDVEMLNDATVYKKGVEHGTVDIAIPEEAKILKLVVGNAGNSAADHANWADPKLYTKAPEGEYTLLAQTDTDTLSVGNTAQITVSATNSDGEPVDLSKTKITYGTESNAVTMTDEGLITGVAAGTAEITVSAEIAGKTLTDTVTITVTSQEENDFYYLCDMDWESATVTTSSGVTVAHMDFDKGDLRLEGAAEAYQHGIGTHAKSEIIYDIEGLEATRFTCDYGASKNKADATNQTSVTFQIYVDGVELLNDTTVYKKGVEHGTADIAIPEDAKTLKLMVGDGGNGIGSDHANWADPKLYMENPDQKVTLSVSVDKAIMFIDDTAQLLVSAENLIGEAVDLSKSKISYTTGSNAVTVTDKGVVTGVSSGTAEITVSVEIAGKVFSDKVTIKVRSAEEQEKYNLRETVAAPTDAENGPQITFVLEDGKPYYLVKYAGSERIEKSELGMEIGVNGEAIALREGFVVVETVRSSGDETWSPVVGETSEIRDYYNQSSVTLEHEASNLRLTVELRAYDTGTAFRYVLPEIPEGQECYKITNERTYFEFPAGDYTAYGYYTGNQVHADKIAGGVFKNGNYRRPMTLMYADGAAMTICEAKLDNYAVMELWSPEKDTLKAAYSQVAIEKDHPGVSPWRTFVLAENENGLQQNSSIVMNLNDPADEETYHFSEWVEAGTCLRVYRSKPGKTNSDLTMEAILKSIDLAAADDIPFISLDTGWYGPEKDSRVDPRLDPTLISEGNKLGNYVTKEGCFTTNGKPFNVFGSLEDIERDDLPVSVKYIYTDVDIPAMCEYAEEKGVGVILYVNMQHLQKTGDNGYTVDELFERLARWGVSGVKPGFVKHNTQEAEAFVQEVIVAAAKHRLVLSIHDEWVPTGTERTFPNMLTAEGIRGDESMEGQGSAREIGYGDLRSLFARTVQGTADHTFCYPGKGTKVYALASPLMFRTGLNFLYWFTSPDKVPATDQGKMGFWKGLPATWDETLYLEGKMDQYATYARRNGERWWLGSLTDNARTLTVELDFLEAGKKYVADIYADEAASKNIENIQYIVDSTTTLERDLKEHGGYAVKLAEATQEEINTLPWYGMTPYAISVNKVEGGTADVQVTGKAGADELVTIVIADVEDGKQVKTVAVTGADGTPVDATKTAEGYTFTMPAQDVSISATLETTLPPACTHEEMTHTEDKAATCTEAGNKEYWYCSKCVTYFSDAEGVTETTLENTVIPKLAHNFGEVWKSDETSHWHVCTICNTEKQDEAVHEPDRETPTETDPVKCKICNYTIAAATGHKHAPDTGKWLYDEVDHWHGCIGCEEQLQLDKSEHSGGKATCKARAVCEICGQPYGALAGHNYGWAHDDEQHWKKCTDCSAVDESPRINHDWKLNNETSTETEKHYDCECGATKTERVEQPELDKTPIDQAIAAAEAAKAGIVVNDGNPSDVTSGTKFVSTVVKKTLDDAIQAAKDAKSIVDSDEAVQETVKTLNAAVASFIKAVQTGSYVPSYTPPSNTTTKTEKHEDGSTTKTVTNKTTGTVTETTTKPNGDKSVVETKKDGTVTTTATDKAGLKTETVTTPEGKTTAKVTLPKDTESARVTVPVKETTPGTVAVIVREDGTREIIKTSVSTEDGLRVTLIGNARLEIVDNSKNFDDMAEDHWAADAVQFVASRELFDGTGKESFSPIMDMSRAMLVTVLARLDGVDTAGGETWYNKATEWGKGEGITDGTNLEASITRESLAVMLWRYAGEPTAEGEVKTFADSSSVSDWASDAMAWAVKTGIISGKGGNTLDPQGSATRAEVAAMLMRFIAQ